MYGIFRVSSFEFSWRSFGALCEISGIKIFERLLAAATVFFQFQPNFIENMAVREEYRLLLFWRSAKF